MDTARPEREGEYIIEYLVLDVAGIQNDLGFGFYLADIQRIEEDSI